MSIQRFIRAQSRKPETTRDLLLRSFEASMHSPSSPGCFTFTPAAYAGMLLHFCDGITAHALDEAIDLEKRFPHMRATASQLERVVVEERAQRAAEEVVAQP